ncbi:MAG: FlgD immunoglobulin-like domain containing protein [bacterium]
MRNAEGGSRNTEFRKRDSEGGSQNAEEGGASLTLQENEAIVRMKEFLGQLIELGIKEQVPAKSALGQNYPNPVNPETWIPFALSEKSKVEVQIYNLAGQLIRTLELGLKEPGSYLTKKEATYWDGKDDEGKEVSSGIYLYQLRAGSYISGSLVIAVMNHDAVMVF